MKRFVPLVALVLSPCGSDGMTGSRLTLADLVGNWSVTRDQLINAADSTERVDILPPGTAITLAVGTGGAFTLHIVFPDGSTITDVGTLTLSRAVTSQNE